MAITKDESAELVELEIVIGRCNTTSKQEAPSVLERAPRMLLHDELSIKREDLRVLLKAATWRAGYIQGKGGR